MQRKRALIKWSIYQLKMRKSNKERRFAITVKMKRLMNLKSIKSQTFEANIEIKQKSHLRLIKSWWHHFMRLLSLKTCTKGFQLEW